jgi:lysophospholipase L1-like esterase
MKRSAKKDFIYALVVLLGLVLVLEITARLAESQFVSSFDKPTQQPGWQTELFGTLFEWHEPDPEVLWRFKAGLDNSLIQTNSDHLLGQEISVSKSKDEYRILLLGDSSPVGLGLTSRRMAFGEIARYMLDKYFKAEKNVELVNAAVSGYSSEQIVRFLETRGWSYDPDVVIVYCGNNDASISGVYSDQELLQFQKLKTLRSIFSRLSIYRVMRSFFAGIGLRQRAGPDNQDEGQLKVRVSPERFSENISTIADQCYHHNCTLIILKPPVPYLWPAGLQFKPFQHLTGTEGQMIMPHQMFEILGNDIAYCIDSSRFEQLYGTGDIFTQYVYGMVSKDTVVDETTIDRYKSMLLNDPENPSILNNLGVAYWRRNQCDKANDMLRRARQLYLHQTGDSLTPADMAAGSPILYNIGINLLSLETHNDGIWYDRDGAAFRYLDSALQADFISLRIKQPYWDVIDKMGSYPGATVIDLPKVFDENGGENLFIDHCHPTAEGHRLIAREIVEAIVSNVR